MAWMFCENGRIFAALLTNRRCLDMRAELVRYYELVLGYGAHIPAPTTTILYLSGDAKVLENRETRWANMVMELGGYRTS